MEHGELVDVFGFAQRRFWSELDLHQCPRRGRFAADDACCGTCETSVQCEWLKQHGDVAALGRRTHQQLVDGLEVAMTSIYPEVAGHVASSSHCGCHLCSWVQSAETLYDTLVRCNTSYRAFTRS